MFGRLGSKLCECAHVLCRVVYICIYIRLRINFFKVWIPKEGNAKDEQVELVETNG